jgi:hypothetical protein
LNSRRKIRKGTRRSYEAHIRLSLRPHLGHLPIDRMRVVHIAAMFDAIDADNEFIRAARLSGDTAQRAAVKGRRVVGAATENRARRHGVALELDAARARRDGSTKPNDPRR